MRILWVDTATRLAETAPGEVTVTTALGCAGASRASTARPATSSRSHFDV